ncbi:MAG TPA: type 4a pilus biogenesis protein PilO [Candidatus Paceibacterota bacterium]|nr:type 4a pilus biogenesis protein PilO [Candidatus Paceibacterota bacterium]
MTRFILPVILIAASVGLFVLYISPTYQNIKVLSVQAATYDDALSKSAELRTLRDKLLATRASFSNGDVQKLTRVLPDNVDNIRLIIDINNIAARHGLSLSGVELGSTSNAAKDQSSAAVGPSGSQVGSVTVGFGVTTDYDTFNAFLQDLEHSLRIVDITKIAFTAGGGSLQNYTMEIRTYWLH